MKDEEKDDLFWCVAWAIVFGFILLQILNWVLALIFKKSQVIAA